MSAGDTLLEQVLAARETLRKRREEETARYEAALERARMGLPYDDLYAAAAALTDCAATITESARKREEES